MSAPYYLTQSWPNVTSSSTPGERPLPNPSNTDPLHHASPADSTIPTILRPSAPAEWAYIDSLSLNHAIGWAWNPENPTETVDIELLDDDQVLLTITANIPRADLRDAGIGTGNHGFVIDNINFLLPKSRHLLRLRNARTKIELPGSPRLLTRHDAGFDEHASDFIDGVLSNIANHATSTASLDEAIALVLSRLNDLINARFRLEAPAKPDITDSISRVRLTDWTNDLVSTLLQTYRPIVSAVSLTLLA